MVKVPFWISVFLLLWMSMLGFYGDYSSSWSWSLFSYIVLHLCWFPYLLITCTIDFFLIVEILGVIVSWFKLVKSIECSLS